MKTIKEEIIKNYAHDYRDQNLNQEQLEEMIWAFWREQEPISRKEHLSQFASTINSHGFYEWYLKDTPQTEIKEIPQFEGTLQALDKLTITNLTPHPSNKGGDY